MFWRSHPGPPMSSSSSDHALLEIGAQCALPGCLHVDFLPIKCACGRVFCRAHVFPDDHACEARPPAPVATASSSAPLARCASTACDKPSLHAFVLSDGGGAAPSAVAALCPRCRLGFCARCACTLGSPPLRRLIVPGAAIAILRHTRVPVPCLHHRRRARSPRQAARSWQSTFPVQARARPAPALRPRAACQQTRRSARRRSSSSSSRRGTRPCPQTARTRGRACASSSVCTRASRTQRTRGTSGSARWVQCGAVRVLC
jgi:hypothetical protein